jgi:hypothetical protein
MPTTAGLYYPWMHFQSDEWLKLAILTWDNIARVRPLGIDDRDSEVVKKVRDMSDFVIELTPSERDLLEVEAAVAEVLDVYRDQLLPRYGWHNRTDWDEDLLWLPPPSNRPYLRGGANP